MGEKRKFSATVEQSKESASASPYISMFESFRVELDEHHDRRERIIKASRDVTAASKKIIFALQRVRTVNEPLQPEISKSIQPHTKIISDRFSSVVADLQSMNAHRYARQITSGIQEWIEAQIFQHYLETQQILDYEQAKKNLSVITTAANSSSPSINLTLEDYILGVFDATGELMRFAITNMATSGEIPQILSDETKTEVRTVLRDLQSLRTFLVTLAAKSDFEWVMRKDVNAKLEVMLTSVEKVEKAVYGLIVRGKERPKGWIPDLSEMAMENEV